MLAYLVDTVLLVALVVTTLSIWSVHRRLRQLDGQNRELRRVFKEMGAAIETSAGAISAFKTEGCAVAVTLGSRVEEARQLLGEIDRRVVRHDRSARPPVRKACAATAAGEVVGRG